MRLRIALERSEAYDNGYIRSDALVVHLEGEVAVDPDDAGDPTGQLLEQVGLGAVLQLSAEGDHPVVHRDRDAPRIKEEEAPNDVLADLVLDDLVGLGEGVDDVCPADHPDERTGGVDAPAAA